MEPTELQLRNRELANASGGVLPNTPINQQINNSSDTSNTPIIPAASLGNNASLQFATAQANPAPTIQSILNSSQNTVGSINSTIAGSQNASDEITNRIAELMGQASNQGADTINALNDPNITGKQTQLSDLMGVITQKSNALNESKVSDQLALSSLEGRAGSGQLAGGVERNQRLLRREQELTRTADAVQLGSLIANAQLLQGEIQTATDTANRTIELKYKDIETQLNNALFFLQRNDAQLTDAQKKLSEERQTQLQLQLQQVQDQKDADLSLVDLKRQVAEAGGDARTLSAMDNATPEEAQSIANQVLSQNAQTQQARETELFDAQLLGAQLSNAEKVRELKGIVDSIPITDIIGTQEFKAQESDTQLDILLESADIPAGIRTNIGNVLSVVEQAKAFANANTDGSFKGLAPLRLVPGVLRSEEAINNQQFVESINLLTQKWASGAALTDRQTEQVEDLVPKRGDTDQQARSKLNGIINFMMADVNGKLRAAGISGFDPKDADLFNDAQKAILGDNEFNSLFDSAVSSTPSSFDAGSFF